MGEGDEYEDQYIDDGPQMVNNNSGVGIGMDEETEERVAEVLGLGLYQVLEDNHDRFYNIEGRKA